MQANYLLCALCDQLEYRPRMIQIDSKAAAITLLQRNGAASRITAIVCDTQTNLASLFSEGSCAGAERRQHSRHVGGDCRGSGADYYCGGRRHFVQTVRLSVYFRSLCVMIDLI